MTSCFLLLNALLLAGSADTYLCNPFLESRQGVPGLGSKQVAANTQPEPGLWLVTADGDGRFLVQTPKPHRAFVLDRNGNRRPDFAGDRWGFDGEGDGLADTIVDFTDANGDGKAESITFFLSGADTLGSPYQPKPPEPRPTDRYPMTKAMDPEADLGPPVHRWLDKSRDGSWTSGSILEGGEVSADWVTLDREHCVWDHVANPTQTYHLWNGTAEYRWPQVDHHDWRNSMGTFDWRKNVNPLLADLRKKYDLWMNAQDAPHGVIDLDGDGLRDVFVGASVSGGPTQIIERPEQAPLLWQTLERLLIGFHTRRLDFNIDFNPYKKGHPGGDVTLKIKNFEDAWGNRLERVVGAFTPPSGWNGKALSAFKPDGTPADWMWLWDWHLTKPYNDLYVASWLKDMSNAGEGAAVYASVPNIRVEADTDCSTDFTVYHTPIIDWYHLQGVEWGWWQISVPTDTKAQELYRNLIKTHRLFHYNQFRYGNETFDPDMRRFYATAWGSYYDLDGDGTIDTYLVDADNDGAYDARVWYRHADETVLWSEGNEFRQTALKLDFPAQSLRLGNYMKLRDEFRRQMAEDTPLLGPDGSVHIEDGAPASPEAVVAVDCFHPGSKPYANLQPPGFSRLFTSIARRPVVVVDLTAPIDQSSLDGMNLLVMTDTQQALEKDEVDALLGWLQQGGQLLLVLPSADRVSSALDGLLAGLGMSIVPDVHVEVTGRNDLAAFEDAEGNRLAYPIDKDGMSVAAGQTLTVEAPTRALLTYRPPEADPKILAAERTLGKGRAIVVASPSLVNNRFTSFMPERVSAFGVYRLANRAWLEELVESLLPSQDAYARIVLGDRSQQE